MAFLKVGTTPSKKQRLYLLEIEMPSGMRVIKIGKASGPSSKERMLQICASIFDKFRCTAKIRIKRDREVPADKVFEFETRLHNFFNSVRYNTRVAFSGSTECFVIPVDDAVQAYEAVLNGMVPEHEYTLPEPELDKYGIPF